MLPYHLVLPNEDEKPSKWVFHNGTSERKKGTLQLGIDHAEDIKEGQGHKEGLCEELGFLVKLMLPMAADYCHFWEVLVAQSLETWQLRVYWCLGSSAFWTGGGAKV